MQDDLDLFGWAESRPKAEVIGITKHILRRYVPGVTIMPEPAELIDFANAAATLKSSFNRATGTRPQRDRRRAHLHD